MNRETPDRVPVMCQMSIGHMLLQTGIRLAELWFSAERFAEGLLELRRRYAFDGILVSLHGHAPGWERRVREVSAGEDGETVFWKNGDRTFFPGDDLPLHYPSESGPQPGLASFRPESIPEEINYIPVSQGLRFDIDPAYPYDIFDIISREAGADFSVHAEVTSPFDYLLDLFGFEEALAGLVEHQVRCKDILGRFTDGVIRIAVEQAGRGVDAVKISSPHAGAGFISPRFYREFVLPYEARIVQAVQALGIPAYLHTCGAIGDRLEIMAESGAAGIECLDPPPLGNVELAEAKRRLGSRVFVKGNIDPVNTLLHGTRETIEKDVRHRLRVGRPGGGYILSTACSIAPHTPPENIEILMQLAEEFGAC